MHPSLPKLIPPHNPNHRHNSRCRSSSGYSLQQPLSPTPFQLALERRSLMQTDRAGLERPQIRQLSPARLTGIQMTPDEIQPRAEQPAFHVRVQFVLRNMPDHRSNIGSGTNQLGLRARFLVYDIIQHVVHCLASRRQKHFRSLPGRRRDPLGGSAIGDTSGKPRFVAAKQKHSLDQPVQCLFRNPVPPVRACPPIQTIAPAPSRTP